ncbi:DUF4214 domain-containing protein [Vreelandella maris]|uniref:DUF4214 domain-containing protein n=1 Tax=Vreelandella maris TaxID=2729617 RepID=UPI0030EEF51E
MKRQQTLGQAQGAAEEMSLIIGGGLTGSMKGFASMLSESIISLGRDDGLAAGFQSVTDTATGMLAVYNDMLPAFAEANNLTEAQTDRIEMLAGGVDLLGDAAIIAAGIYTGRFVAAMAAGTVSLVNKTRASIADTQAESAAAAATVRRTAAERQAAMAILSTANLEARATKGTAAHTFALQQLSVARTRAATAAGAHTAAMNTATAAAARASGASRALGGALALVGGPLGLLVGVGGLLYVFRDELGLTGRRAGLTEDQISALRDEMQDMSQDDLSQSLSSLNNALDTATIKAATAREELAQLRSENRGSGFLGFEGGQVGAEISGMQAVAEAQERILKLNQEVAVARGENAERIEQNANAFVVYADKLREERDATEEAEEFTKSLTDATDAAADSTYTLSDAYDSLLDRITPNRREARQYARDLGVLNLALASGRMTTTQYMQAMGMLQESFQAAQRDTSNLADTAEDAGSRIASSFTTWGTVADNTIRSVDDAGRDAWLGLVDGSTSALDTVENAFEQTFANIAHMLTTQKLTFEVAGMMGLDTSGMPGGGQQGGGGFNLSSMGSVKNAWGAVQNGFGGIQWTGASNTAYAGNGWANAATQGTGATGFMGGSTTNFSGATGLASLGAGFAGSYAGTELGSSVFGREANSNYGSMAGGAIGTYLGGPVGAFLGSTLGGLADSLFGSSEKTFDFDFLQGQHSYVFGDRTSAFGDSGLTALSDYKLGEQQDQLNDMLTAMAEFDNRIAATAIPERFDAMKEAIDGFTHSGAEDLFETRLREMITGGEVWAAEAVASITDPEKLAQGMLGALQLEQIGGRLGSELSAEIQAAISDARGDGAADVVNSIMAQAQAAEMLVNSVERLNLQFDATAQGALAAAGGLSDYVGGLDNIAAVNQAYYNAAFSESERLSYAQQDLLASLTSVTDEAPRTVAELRAMVEAQSLNSESSAQLAYDLMALAPALKETNTAVRQAIEQQYQDVLGRAPAGDGLDYWFNQVASGALTLEGALWNIENSAEAAAGAVNVAAGALAPVETAWDALNASVDAERQILEGAYRDTTASIERNIRTVQSAMQETDRMANSLQSTLDQMMGASARGQQSQFETSSNYLRSVLSGGGLGDPDQLDRALSAVANPSQDTYETLQDYQRDFLSTANVVDQLRDRADEQLTTEERSLRALERQLSQADLQFDREMSALDATLETQREQLEAQFGAQEWLSTVNDSVLSIADAIAALEFEQAKAVAGGAGGPGGGDGSSEIEAIYQSSLGKSADAEGEAYWESTGLTGNALKDAIEYSAWVGSGKTQQFADGGIATGPMSGYPVTMHGTEAVIPLKGGSIPLNVPGIQALVREVSQLRSELAASQRAIAENTRKSARVLEREELERRQEEAV